MRAVFIGMDRRMFEEGSVSRRRIAEFGRLFEEFHAVVFSLKKLGLQEDALNGGKTLLHPTNSKNKLFYIRDAFKICRKIISSSGKPDLVVSCQDPFETGLIGLLLKLRFGVALNVEIHTDFCNRYFVFHSPMNFLRFFTAHLILPFADSVRVVSEKVKASIEKLNGKIVVLPINIETQKPELAGTPSSRSGKRILSVCRLEKEKDLKTAIKAFSMLRQKFPEALLTIVGEGREKQDLENFSRGLGLGEAVRFVGWRQDTEEFYRNSGIYISTSLYEGYGMSVIEAASSGLPLVLSDTGVAGSVFKNGEEAFVCRQRDWRCFAEALGKLCSDNGLASEMGRKAKESAVKSLISQEEYLEKYRQNIYAAAGRKTQ